MYIHLNIILYIVICSLIEKIIEQCSNLFQYSRELQTNAVKGRFVQQWFAVHKNKIKNFLVPIQVDIFFT